MRAPLSSAPEAADAMTANEPARRLTTSILWIACLVLVHLGIMFVARYWDDWHLLKVASFAPTLLLAWWAAVSRVRISWKLGGYCLGMTVIFIIFSRSRICVFDRWDPSPWINFEWLVWPPFKGITAVREAPLVLLLLLITSRLPRRWRLQLATPFQADPSDHVGGVWQCTLGDLLLLTFALAATLGLLLWAAPYPTQLSDLPHAWLWHFTDVTFATAHSLAALGGVLATLVAAWLILGTGRLRWRLPAVVPVTLWPAASTALICKIAWEKDVLLGLTPLVAFTDALPLEYRLTLSLFAVLTASFLMVRLAGCRLHCGVGETQGQE